MDSLRKKPLPQKNALAKISAAPALVPRHLGTIQSPANDSFRGPRNTIPPQRKPAPKYRGALRKTLLQGLAFLGMLILFTLGYFSWKVGSATRSISVSSQKDTALLDTIHGATSLLAPVLHHTRAPLPGELDGRTNILIFGKAKEKDDGQNLTDTIMVASFDFSRKKIALLSLPRDLYVEIPGTNVFTKLNVLYQIDQNSGSGADTIRQAVSTITGLPIHAFAALDYDGFTRIVDIVGGISLYVNQDLFDPRFPGPNYSYETFSLQKGWQDLDGATALKYVRERHSDPEGDFGRAKRQQAVLSALKKKAFSLKTLLNPIAISGVIDTLGSHIRTDLSLENMQSLVELASEFDTANIATAVIDAWKKDSLLRVSHVPVGAVSMFILLPRTGDWSETRELASSIFDLDSLKARQEAIEAEDARIAIINESDAPTLGTRVARFLSENLHLRHVQIIPTSRSRKDFFFPENTPGASDVIRRSSTEVIRTADEIAKKLSLPSTDTNAPFDDAQFRDTDILVILGNDLAKRLSFEEDTVDDMQNAERDPKYQKELDDALGMRGK